MAPRELSAAMRPAATSPAMAPQELSAAMRPATVATSPAETPTAQSKPRSPVGMETQQAGL